MDQWVDSDRLYCLLFYMDSWVDSDELYCLLCPKRAGEMVLFIFVPFIVHKQCRETRIISVSTASYTCD